MVFQIEKIIEKDIYSSLWIPLKIYLISIHFIVPNLNFPISIFFIFSSLLLEVPKFDLASHFLKLKV
jgi:hypothetical protein